MTIEGLILAAICLAFGLGVAAWARWSGNRLERNDPARRGPAE